MLGRIVALILVVWLPQAGHYSIRNVTRSGVVLDRVSDRDTVSIAASGFAMINWALLLPKQEAVAKVNRCIATTLRYNSKNKGWLYHFTDAYGVPRPDSEVSTIDTAIFYAGARRAAELLDDPKLSRTVETLIKNVDVEFVRQGKYVCHGFRWAGNTPSFLGYVWDDYSEGVIIYRTFGIDWIPRRVSFDLPLFVYYYPLAFFRDDSLVGYLREAVRYQKKEYGYWGVTACDGPNGYQVNDKNIVSPLSMLTVSRILPEFGPDLDDLRIDIESPAFDLRSSWVARDRLGIDDMCCVAIFGQYAEKGIDTRPLP